MACTLLVSLLTSGSAVRYPAVAKTFQAHRVTNELSHCLFLCFPANPFFFPPNLTERPQICRDLCAEYEFYGTQYSEQVRRFVAIDVWRMSRVL